MSLYLKNILFGAGSIFVSTQAAQAREISATIEIAYFKVVPMPIGFEPVILCEKHVQIPDAVGQKIEVSCDGPFLESTRTASVRVYIDEREREFNGKKIKAREYTTFLSLSAKAGQNSQTVRNVVITSQQQSAGLIIDLLPKFYLTDFLGCITKHAKDPDLQVCKDLGEPYVAAVYLD